MKKTILKWEKWRNGAVLVQRTRRKKIRKNRRKDPEAAAQADQEAKRERKRTGSEGNLPAVRKALAAREAEEEILEASLEVTQTLEGKITKRKRVRIESVRIGKISF